MTPTCTIHVGDCRAILPTLEADSVDAIVTDPPYELGFMGKDWDRSGVSFDPETWRGCLRVLKPGGHLLAFGGTRTFHRIASAIEDAGFEIRDMISWVYGSGFPKSKNLQGEWKGWGTALKPALEPIVMARKPFAGTVASNVAAYGTGALNIDGCRVDLPPGDWLADGLKGDYDRLDTADTDTQWGFKRVDRAAGLGRWPANLIHDGSAEVIEQFPVASGQLAKASTSDTQRARQNTYGKMACGSNGQAPRGDSGSAARFFYCAKASRADRNFGTEDRPELPLLWSNGKSNPGSFQSDGTKRAATNPHPTVKPTELMRYLCRLVTPPSGLVLDPFTGSGSTGKACRLEGFAFVGIELSPDYAAIARRRCNVTPGLALS